MGGWDRPTEGEGEEVVRQAPGLEPPVGDPACRRACPQAADGPSQPHRSTAQMRPSSGTALPRGASKVTTLQGAATPLAARRPSLVEPRSQAVVDAVLLTLDARSAHPADVQIP